MPNRSEASQRRLVESLYIPAGQRMDCCARCDASRPRSDDLFCQRLRSTVASLGVCAEWRPMARRIPA